MTDEEFIKHINKKVEDLRASGINNYDIEWELFVDLLEHILPDNLNLRRYLAIFWYIYHQIL